MAVISSKYGTGLVLELKVGEDEKGNDKIKNKSISKINRKATDEDLFAVGKAISEVLMYDMLSIRRIDKSTLLG